MTAVGSGRWVSRQYRLRVGQLEGFIRLIGLISSRIAYCNAPLCEIYAAADIPALADFIGRLRAGESFGAALNDGSLCLDGETGALLRDFSASLGRTGQEEQLSLCEYTLGRLRGLYEGMREELPKKTRLSETLGLLAGTMAVILLL